MPYAITVQAVPLLPADTLRARLSVALQQTPHDPPSMGLPEARAQELSCAKGRLFDNAKHRNEIPRDFVAQLAVAEDRARKSAREYEAAAAVETQTALLLVEAKAGGDSAVIQGCAMANAVAKANEAKTLKQAQEDEKLALAAIARALAVTPPEHYDHVLPLFDKQIEAGLDAVVALVQAGVLGGARAVTFQLAGHVEDKTVGNAQASVHVWPA